MLFAIVALAAGAVLLFVDPAAQPAVRRNGTPARDQTTAWRDF
ncbi:hypothetical protein [Variovorax sp. JS1663]|nr:hypothetical protein [Variovorax sp. JS1663]